MPPNPPRAEKSVLQEKLLARLAKRKEDEFNVAIRMALQRLDLAQNGRQGEDPVALLDLAVNAYERHEHSTAKLLIYCSGLITSPPQVVETVLRKLQ